MGLLLESKSQGGLASLHVALAHSALLLWPCLLIWLNFKPSPLALCAQKHFLELKSLEFGLGWKHMWEVLKKKKRHRENPKRWDKQSRDWVKTLSPSGLVIKLKGCRSKALSKNKQRNVLRSYEISTKCNHSSGEWANSLEQQCRDLGVEISHPSSWWMPYHERWHSPSLGWSVCREGQG